MRMLKFCLWVVGALCLLPVVVLFLPMATYRAFSGVLIDVQLPDHRLFAYAIRVASATSVLVGIFYIMLALKPHRYGLMLPFAGAAPIFLGITSIVAGVAEGISFFVFGGDAVLSLLMGGLILYFWYQEKSERSDTRPEEAAAGEGEDH